MLTDFKEFHCICKEIICQSTFNKLTGICLKGICIIFVLVPFLLFSQSTPDSGIYNKTILKLAQNSDFKTKSKNQHYHQLRLTNNNLAQCISITSIKTKRIRKKILIFWQKDTNNKWTEISYIIANSFKFIDFDSNGIMEIECIDKQRNKNRRDKVYRLVSLINGIQTEMYSYHQYEYYNVTYIQSNIAPDSVFAVNHSISIKDIDWDGIPELTDIIEIKYRKLPCCDHHFEYGIREKKLVLRLINGKFDMY
jgi:hypothetical protein